MKVLACIREDYKQNIGGDSVQFSKTIEYLKKKGIDITVSHGFHDDMRPYDIVHIFNTIRIRDTYKYFSRAKACRKKIVLTPIYWDYGMYLHKNLNIASYRSQWLMDNLLRKEVIKGANILLPSSIMERDLIERDFKVNIPYKIVYNGVDISFESGDSKFFLEKFRMRDDGFVLSVGRICPHKNQRTLAKVCSDADIPLVLVGPINDTTYFEECKKENNKLIHIGELRHEELISAYRSARVHSLVSWYETPGLVSLEAGLAGCNILTTPEGSTKEYFKEYVEYCMWNDYENYFKKLNELFNKERSSTFQKYIHENFLWEKVTESIVEAYKSLKF